MAETYRGLTIKIGGDTSTLQKALKAANGAISETQSQLRTIGQALKFDPGSMNAINIQLGLIDDKAEDTAYKLSTLREAYEQVAEKQVNGTPMKELAEDTHNAALRASVMLDEYNKLTATLATQFTQLTKLSEEFGNGLTFNVEKGMTAFDKVESEAKEIEAALEEAFSKTIDDEDAAGFVKLEEKLQRLNAIMDTLKGNKDAFKVAFSGLQDANAVVQFQQLENEIAKTEAQAKSLAKQMVELGNGAALKESLGESLNDIKSMDTALQSAIQRFKVLDTAAKLDPTNVDKANARTQALAQVTDLAAKKEDLLREAMAKLDASKTDALVSKYGSLQNAVTQTTRTAEDFAQKVVNLEGELAQVAADEGFKSMIPDILDTDKSVDGLTDSVIQLREQLRGARSDLDNAMGEVNTANACAQVQQLGDEATKTHNTVAEVGRDMTNTFDEVGRDMTNTFDEAAFQQVVGRISQLAQQAGRAMVESANTIDSAYRDMRKTVEGTEQEFSSLRESAIRFSQTNFTSADTILSIEALGGQLGIAASSLQDFGEAISSVVIATDIGAEDAALKFGQLTNVMSDLNDTTFENVADSLVRLGNTTATTESAIMEVAQRMASVANVTSMTTPELLAWSAAISSTGLRSESAATSISKTIVGIGQAVASGGEDLKQFAAIAGMTASEFEQAWANSSSDALEAFVKGLADLTDDSTAAIEALDHVGISSVRQETALLALSQTVENLDEAMYNSVDAFNGGGDAAREADKKSEGFSGTLAMLQNNASNLAASLGDGLIPAMRLLSGLLSVLTNFLDALPGPLKSAVAELGLAAIATGALVAALQGLGMNGAVESIRGFVAQLLGLQAAEAAATAGATGLTAALSAIPVLGAIVAATAAVNAFAEAVGDCIEHVNLMRDATDGLRGAHDMLEKSYSETSGMTTTLEDMETAHREALQSVADFGDRMRETWSDVGTNMAMAERYAETIKELGNSGEISAQEMSTLRNAINSYNEITGASIQLIGDETSALNIQAGAIDDVTEAYKRRAEAAAYEELLAEATRKQIENELKLKETREELAELTADGVWLDETARLHELEQTESDLSKVGEELSKTIDDLTEGMTDTARASDDYSTALVSAGMDTKDFAGLSDEEQVKLNEIQAALAAAGHSLTDYGTLNAEQMQQIIAAWNGSVPQIIAAIRSISSAAASAASSVGSIDTTELKRQQEGIYTARKRKYDDDYEAYKRSLDDRYDALKSSLDSDYDAQKAAFDSEYRERKSAYDKDYGALKSSLDKQYQERKSAYDKEYKALKSGLDASYKARQKELDKEYKAEQKASQRDLKEYKSYLDKKVDAFKKATDERVDAMKKEQEYREKLIDDDAKGKTDSIDAEIARLKGITQAEEDAEEERERAEKTAELEKDVRDAKSRRKRMEAEKALSDYLNEIALDDAKRDRERRIEELDDEKDLVKEEAEARKDALDESYDAEIAAYKESRELKLEALKEANDAEYEARKEAEEQRLELLKEQQTEELEQLKSANDEKLEAKKDWQDAELQALKEANDAQLEATKEWQDAELQALKDSQSAALDSIKASNDASIAEMKRANEDDLTEKKRYYEDRLKRLKRAQEDELAEAKAGNAKVSKEAGDFQTKMEGIGSAMQSALIEKVESVRDALGLSSKDASDDVKASAKDAADTASSESSRGASSTVDNYSWMAESLSGIGSSAMGNLESGMSSGGTAVQVTAANIAGNVSSELSAPATYADTWGWDMLVNFGNGIIDSWNRNVFPELQKMAQTIADYLGFSVPKKGPLHHQDEWGLHFMQNLESGMRAGFDGVMREVESVASGITDGLDIAPEIADPVEALLDDMRSHDAELATQARLMSEIVENGFDPHMSVDAAYEAMDRLRAGRMADAMAVQESTQTQNVSVTVNLSGVSMSGEHDIEKLVDEIERRVAANISRRSASTIGGRK